MSETSLLWQPSAERIAKSRITRFRAGIEARHGIGLPDYPALHRWSVENMESFWAEVWDFTGVGATTRGERVLVDGGQMPGARWFPDACLNFAENLLRRRDPADAIVFRGEDRAARRLSHGELAAEVAAVRAALLGLGVRAGDRVASYLPNIPEAVIAMLASASIGAIWSSCSPDFGIQGVLDRFGQIEPVVLFAVDGYYYNGKPIPVGAKVAEIGSRLPTCRAVIVCGYLDTEPVLPAVAGAISWRDFVAPHVGATLAFDAQSFAHPLAILFSSGTTGPPKCLVHSAGGTLLQHLKEHVLHGDLGAGDRLFYFTTCGWMMWNWLVSGLAAGATLLLYDGSPFIDRGRVLWDFAEEERITHFGTAARYIEAIRKIGLVPCKDYALEAMRTIYSTGSPLAPDGFDYVYQCVKNDVCLSSISGGTDIISCFALGNPTLPVWRGELQCPGLGMAVDVFDETGRPVRGDKGELVCTAPFPSMPVGFWDDPGDVRYRATYFERFPGLWCHGDWVEFTVHGGLIVYGRSDSTLNPGGVRIGTAEIYRQVEHLDEVVESLAIGQQWPPGETGDSRVILFVRLRDGLRLDAALVERIKSHIRTHTTPRHVPAKVIQVPEIPRTRSNKIVELAVRDVVHGRPVRNLEVLANPEALAFFRDLPELKT